MDEIISRCYLRVKEVSEYIRRRWSSEFPKDECIFLLNAVFEALHTGAFNCDPVFRQIVEEVILKILQKYFTSDALNLRPQDLVSVFI